MFLLCFCQADWAFFSSFAFFFFFFWQSLHMPRWRLKLLQMFSNVPAQHPSWEGRLHSVVLSHQTRYARPKAHLQGTLLTPTQASVHKSPNRADISDSTTLQSILHTTYDLVFLKQSYLHVLLIEFSLLISRPNSSCSSSRKLSLNSSPL